MGAGQWRARGTTPRFAEICRSGENHTPPLEMLSIAQHRKILGTVVTGPSLLTPYKVSRTYRMQTATISAYGRQLF